MTVSDEMDLLVSALFADLRREFLCRFQPVRVRVLAGPFMRSYFSLTAGEDRANCLAE
jgi:hypothetical protein